MTTATSTQPAPICCPLRRLYAADGAVQTWLSAVDPLFSDDLRDLSAEARTANAHRFHLNQTGFGVFGKWSTFHDRPV